MLVGLEINLIKLSMSVSYSAKLSSRPPKSVYSAINRMRGNLLTNALNGLIINISKNLCPQRQLDLTTFDMIRIGLFTRC